MKITKGQVIATSLSIIGRLPLWACRLVGRFLGFLLWLIPNRNRTTTDKNLALCFPELSKKERAWLGFNSLQHTGMLTFEMAAIWQKPYEWLKKHIVSVKNKKLFDEARQEGKGVILLLPHLGNWEIFGGYIPKLTPMKALYEPPRVAELETLIKSGREKTGAELVPTTQRGVAALLKHLRNGGTTCILPDQVPNSNDRGGVFAPFFNRPAYTMTLVSQLAQKTNCRVLGGAAKRVAGGFAIEFCSPDPKVYSDNTMESVTAINHMVENCVRNFPSQYQWEYKRFRRVPEGGTKIY